MSPQLLFLGTVDAGSRGFFDMFSLNLQTFIQMIPALISFIVLALAFTYFLYKPVRRLLQTRADRIADDIANAEADKATASELKAMYELKIKDIEAERAAILEEARLEANKRLSMILGDAKTEAGEIRERARRDITAERERVKAEVHQAIIDISTDMAAKLVSATIDKRDHDRLFAEALDDLDATAFRPL